MYKKHVGTNVSQRIKDAIANMKRAYTADVRREMKPQTINYTIYRIDDYLVIKENNAILPFYCVSKEYQAQAEARKAAQTKAENKEE